MTTKENPSMDLDELERLLAEATPGPWITTEKRGKRDGYVRAGDRTVADMRLRNGEADAALIVAAVNSLPALIAAARRAEELEKAAQEVLAADGAVARRAVGADRLWDAALAELDAVLDGGRDATDA